MKDIVNDLRIRGLLPDAERIALQDHVTVDEMVGRRRQPHIVEARRSFIRHLSRLGLSASSIGALVDRDHSTVLMHLGGV